MPGIVNKYDLLEKELEAIEGKITDLNSRAKSIKKALIDEAISIVDGVSLLPDVAFLQKNTKTTKLADINQNKLNRIDYNRTYSPSTYKNTPDFNHNANNNKLL